MDWIKQNNKLVISVFVSLLIIGGGGYWVYSQMKRNGVVSQELSNVHRNWETLERQNPHPGTEAVNNIAAAERDLNLVEEIFSSVQDDFAGLNYPIITNNFQFKTMLERTVAGMRKDAANSGVWLQPQYAFTFKDQLDKVEFPSGSLQQWSDQLHEIELISKIIFSKRVHSIERIRRVPIDTSIDVSAGEFIDATIVTNDVAILTPYEVSFKGYSGELASVIEGIGNAPQGFRVRAIKVEPTTIANNNAGAASTVSAAEWRRLQANANRVQQPQPGAQESSSQETNQLMEMRRQIAEQENARYGAETGTAVNRIQQQSLANANQSQAPKISEVVKESPLQVTLLLDFIKPLSGDLNTQ